MLQYPKRDVYVGLTDSLNYTNASLEVFCRDYRRHFATGLFGEHQYATKADRVFIAALIVQFFTLLTDAACWMMLAPPAHGSAPLLRTLYCGQRLAWLRADRALRLLCGVHHLRAQADIPVVRPRRRHRLRRGRAKLVYIHIQRNVYLFRRKLERPSRADV